MIPNKIVTGFLSLLFTVGAVYLAILTLNEIKSRQYIGIMPEERHSIHITGKGRASGVPDIAKIQLGNTTNNKAVSEAQKENSEKMNNLIKQLKETFNIDSKDIQTTNYTIYPQYGWKDSIRTLNGYEVNQTVTVKVRDVSRVSDVLALAGILSLNQIGGLTFEIDDPAKLKEEAREKALNDAKTTAENLADLTGARLGRVLSFDEIGNQYSAVADKSYAVGMGGDGSAAPSIEAGSNEVMVSVDVEYEILK